MTRPTKQTTVNKATKVTQMIPRTKSTKSTESAEIEQVATCTIHLAQVFELPLFRQHRPTLPIKANQPGPGLERR